MTIAKESLARRILETIEGDAWHGPSLRELLADVTPDEAVAHPIPGTHSIIEIVSHVTSWIEEVTARALGKSPSPPASGDWPQQSGGHDQALWPAALVRLREAQSLCEEALAAFPVTRLEELVGVARAQSLGTGVSFEAMFAGLAQHNSYHSGQVALLKRAYRSTLDNVSNRSK